MLLSICDIWHLKKFKLATILSPVEINENFCKVVKSKLVGRGSY